MKNGRYLPWVLALSLVIPLAAVAPAQASEDWDRIISERAPVGSEAVSVDEYGGFERFSTREVAVFEDRAITSRGTANLATLDAGTAT